MQPKSGHMSLLCPGALKSDCTDDACCQPTCQKHTCGAGLVFNANPSSTPCGAQCSDATCCSVTCGHPSFNCSAGFSARLDALTRVCGPTLAQCNHSICCAELPPTPAPVVFGKVQINATSDGEGRYWVVTHTVAVPGQPRVPWTRGALSFSAASVNAQSAKLGGKECNLVGAEFFCDVPAIDDATLLVLTGAQAGRVPTPMLLSGHMYRRATASVSNTPMSSAAFGTGNKNKKHQVFEEDTVSHKVTISVEGDDITGPIGTTFKVGATAGALPTTHSPIGIGLWVGVRGSSATVVNTAVNGISSGGWLVATKVGPREVEITFANADLYPAFSHGVLALDMTLSASAMVSGVPPNGGLTAAVMPKKDLSAAVREAVDVIGAGTSLTSGNPMASTSAGKLGGISSLMNCPPGPDELDMSFLDSPLQLNVGASKFPQQVGAVLGNLILITLIVTAHFMIAVVVRIYRSANGKAGIWLEALGIARFPSFSAIPCLFYYEKITETAYKMIFYGKVWELPVGLCIILTFSFGFPASVWILTRKSSFPAKTYHWPRSNCFLRFLWGEYVWDSVHDRTFFRRWALLFKDFTFDSRNFMLADLGLIHFLGFTHAFKPRNKAECLIQVGATEVLVAGYAAMLIVRRPFIAQFDLKAAFMAALCQMAAVLCIFIAILRDRMTGSEVKVAGAFLIGSSLCVAMMALVDILTWIYERCTGTTDSAARRELQKRRGVAVAVDHNSGGGSYPALSASGDGDELLNKADYLHSESQVGLNTPLGSVVTRQASLDLDDAVTSPLRRLRASSAGRGRIPNTSFVSSSGGASYPLSPVHANRERSSTHHHPLPLASLRRKRQDTPPPSMHGELTESMKPPRRAPLVPTRTFLSPRADGGQPHSLGSYVKAVGAQAKRRVVDLSATITSLLSENEDGEPALQSSVRIEKQFTLDERDLMSSNPLLSGSPKKKAPLIVT